MTPLEIILGAVAVYVTILWAIDRYRWAKQENAYLNRIMAENYQQYVLAEDLRKKSKIVKMPIQDPDIIPIT